MTTPAEFWDRLNRHDWHYAMSDDRSVYRRGAREADALCHIAMSEGEELQALLEAFHKHFHSGRPWGTEQAPKPPRPTDDQ